MANDRSTAETLQSWNSQLEKIRQTQHGNGHSKPGIASSDDHKGKSGLEVMSALLQGQFPPAHMAHTLDYELVEVGDGFAVFQATPQLKHYNPLGTVHGGWYATLLDFALGCAVQSKLPAGRGYTTAQLNVNIVKAANMQTGPLRCNGMALHVGRQVGTAEARIVGPDGKLYAHATTTCVVFETA